MLSPLRMPFRHARVGDYLQLRIIEQAGGILTRHIPGLETLEKILKSPAYAIPSTRALIG